ncbi:MAG: class I SAM-dependent methyltransferase family protein [Candidatus Heimdallarchaeum endolithica]|uniref:tRNA (guanine(37)-N(1))-methyltransferase n=1 Tax=Candidatus Heimdallarchaeum endolithica TaxID=2876572 RepID=A0A9Y1BQ97_9ARCH|nr:MAG: class I SAM-dependent methyltransferase family protein [Candidatus Heimdallarchaeum endolithica]
MSVRSLALKIHYTYGEQTRRWLISNNYLDLNLKISKQGDYLFFPLKSDIENKKTFLNDFPLKKQGELEEFSFKKKEQKPKSLAEALKKIIPNSLYKFIPKSFDQIGDIAIIEFDEILSPFKHEIGKILCTLFPSIKSVYRKSSGVSGEFRLRKIEYLYGDKKTETIHKEYGIRIFVDVEKTYFSPRLGDEHNRIANLVEDGEIVVDMFTSTGPFPLHIAKKSIATIYGIDINQKAIDCLKKSILLNKLKGNIHPIVGDIRTIINDLPKADRVIMNLPKTSIHFLQLATQIFKEGTILHFYSFVKNETGKKDLYNLVNNELSKTDWRIEEILHFQRIRESAPYEIHACIDLLLSSGNT